MKKIISIVLLCTMLLACFAGCGAKQGQIDLNSYAGEVNAENLSASFDTTIDTSEGVYDATNNPDGTYSVYDGVIDDEDKLWYSNGAVNDVYTINTADELMYLFWMINQSQNCTAGANPMDSTITKQPKYSFAGKTIKIARDLVVNTVEAGTTHVDSAEAYTNDTLYQTTHIAGNGNVYFDGTIDGQGNIISGLYQVANGNNRSFFGPLYNATFKDLVIINSFMDGLHTDADKKMCSGISIMSRGAITFTDVYADITVKNSDVNGNTSRCALFVGEVTSGSITMTNCESHGDMLNGGSGMAGAFIGYVKAATSVKLTNCDSYGDITLGVAKSQVGGLIGRLNNATSVTLKNCDVSGDVGYEIDLTKDCNLVGGLVGYSVSSNLTIDTCTFSGTVEGDRSTGGMIGLFDSNKTLTIKNSTVSGTINATLAAEKNLFVGGFAGGVRSINANVYGNTFSGNLNVTINANAAKEWHTGIAPLVGSFADKAQRGTLTLWNNTIGGTMKVVESDGDDAAEMDKNTQYAYYAGKMVGISGERAQLSYLGGNDISGLTVDAETNIEVLAGGAGAFGADKVEVIGYQLSQKNTDTNTYDVRFVAATRGHADALGFVVTMKYIDENDQVHERVKTIYAEYLYESVKGTDDNGEEITYTASQFGNKYLYTLVVKNVPASYVEAAEGEEKFGISLIPFQGYAGVDVVEEVETPWNYSLAGVPFIYGKQPTAVAENTVALTDVGTYASLEALYKTGEDDVAVTPTYEFVKTSYKDNLYYNVDTANGGTDYCVYPSTNAPFNTAEFTALKNVNMMTYTVGEDVEEGTYDLVLKLRVKNTSARKLLMYLNDGEDGYLVGYEAGDVKASSDTDTENSYYVKVGTFTFKAGDTITFKIDTGLSSAMHVRGLYLINAATDVAAAEPQA